MKNIYDSVSGDKIEYIARRSMIEWGCSYEQARDYAEKQTRLDSFRREWSDLAPKENKNYAEEEVMRKKYSPAVQIPLF